MNNHEFSCSLVHLLKFFSRPLKDFLEYRTRGTAHVFTLLMRFLLCSLVSSSFLVLLRYSLFLFFLSSAHVWWCPLPIFPSFCKSLFSVLIFLVLLYTPGEFFTSALVDGFSLKVTQSSTSEIGDAPLYNPCSLPIQVMKTGPLPAPSKCKSGLPQITGMCPGWWKQSFRLRLWYLVWFQVRATSCHLTSSKSAWKSTPKCTWMCWRV